MGNVVVFGSLNMDLAIESPRMPLPGETIAGSGFLANAGGKGANQAVASARYGVPTRLIGAVGRDAFGGSLVDGLVERGVVCDGVFRAEGTETGVAVVLRSGGDNRIILSPGANHALDGARACAALDDVARAGDVLLAQMECDLEATLAVLSRGRALGLLTVLNVAPARELPERVWEWVDVVCVNETECEAVCGIAPDDEASLDAALAALVAKGPSAAIVTLGPRGSAALFEGERLRVGALEVDAVDTTGAGDTFIGVVAAMLAEGRPLGECMRFASRAAGLAASRVGAQQAIPTAGEVRALTPDVR